MNRYTALLVLMSASGVLGHSITSAQTSPDDVWSALSGAELQVHFTARAERTTVEASQLRLFRLDEAEFFRSTAQAPLERLDLPLGGRPEPAVITMPMPDGSFARFRYVESPVMEPELAARHPQIRTYVGQGIDDPAATIRFDKTPAGVHAQVLSPNGTAYIDPYDDATHIAYSKSALVSPDDPFECLVEDSDGAVASRTSAETILRSGSQLRTYRLAMACTGEYAQFHGGTKEGALSAIVTTVNRVTGIYENELAIRLVLIANNDDIVFTDPNTDGYSNDSSSLLLTENQSKLDSVIGTANYDIGHVVNTGVGGRAGLGVVCVDGLKAMGQTGQPTPEGDAFDVDYVAHEIGHQFGAVHTFNGVSGKCSGNRTSSSAYEPGSGSTIMAYAGICDSDNLQPHSDPYFHSQSLGQMFAYVSTGDGSDCASVSATGNAEPAANAGADHTIPRGTAFTLMASATDADGDALTFCWEQRDLGPDAILAAADDGAIPLFRSLSPVLSPARTFPKWSTILANTADNAEKLPQVARNMDFRVTVRDNRVGGGGMASDDVVLTVDDTKGPFAVSYPNGGEVLGGAINLTWSVASTNASPIGVTLVDLVASLDGGNTFDIVLANDVPNDGVQSVVLPNKSSSTARVMVRAVGNVFFDVSNANFQTAVVMLNDVYVDFDHTQLEAGTEPYPFDEVGEALAVVVNGGTVWIEAGSTSEKLVIDQPVTVRVNGTGTVTIGLTP